jgi:hypothetical protein
MKAIRLLTVVVCAIIILSGCKKDSSDDTNNQPAVLFSSGFDSQADLNAWSQSSGGQAVIDSSAVMFTNITNCFQFETVNLIPVQKGKTYELRITGKVNPAISGDPMLCAGNYLVYIVQGSTNIISESFGNYPSWTVKSYSFEATSSAAVKIKFLIGTTRGVWISDLKFIEN